MSLDHITDLASLVAPASTRELIECFLHKKRLLIKTDDPTRAESLLPRWSLDRLIASSFLPVERLQVLKDGEVVPPQTFRDNEGRVRADALENLIAQGVSFIVDAIGDDVPSIAELTDALGRDLGHGVWANAYVTHGSGGALPPHYDDHDVIVLQVHGSKRWFSHGCPTPSPIERSPDGEDFGPAQWDALLSPGDVLYLPRGEVHHATVEGPLSVHLTFGIDARRGIDLLQTIVKEAAKDEAFRADITRLGGDEALAVQERQLKDAMHRLIERANVNGFLLADDAKRAQRPPRRE